MAEDIEMLEMVAFIEEISRMEGTELGGMWRSMCDLWKSRTYMDEKLLKALEKELKATFKYLKKNTKIESHEETKTVVYKELVFLDR